MTISTNTYMVEITHDELGVINDVFDLVNDVIEPNKGDISTSIIGENKETFARLKEQFHSMRWNVAALHKIVNGDYRG